MILVMVVLKVWRYKKNVLLVLIILLKLFVLIFVKLVLERFRYVSIYLWYFIYGFLVFWENFLSFVSDLVLEYFVDVLWCSLYSYI